MELRMREDLRINLHYHGNSKALTGCGRETIRQGRVLVWLCMLTVAVLCSSVASASATSSLTTPPRLTSSSPTGTSHHNTTQKPPITLKPSTKLKYRMELDNSGPAVLDSTLTFWAMLIPDTNASTANWPHKYIFQWMNMANMNMTRKEGVLVSYISIVFPSDLVVAGEYPMTVAAFLSHDPSIMVAFETKKFVLTDKLNGRLRVEQDLEYQRFPDKVLATNRPVQFSASILDSFHSESQPNFKYRWFENQTFVKQTRDSVFSATFPYPTNLTFTSEVFVKFNKQGEAIYEELPRIKAVMGATFLSDSSSSANQNAPISKQHMLDSKQQHLLYSKQRVLRSTNKTQERKHYEKDGNFTVPMLVKDPLSLCLAYPGEGDGKDTVAVGSHIVVNVTCSGSIPSSICWNTSDVNVTSIAPCLPGRFLATTQHQVLITPNKTGWFNLHLFIYNDVSRVHINQSFYAFDPDSGQPPSLYVPIIFGVLGAVIVVIGAVYMMRLRKKRLVEVADFDFHPSLTSSLEANSSGVSRVMRTLKYLLFVRTKNRTANLNQEDEDFSFSTSPFTESTESQTKEPSIYGSL